MSGTFVTVYTSEPDTMKMKNYNIQRRGVLIMKCIGIIGAMEQEVAKIKEKSRNVTIPPEPVWISMRELWKERK